MSKQDRQGVRTAQDLERKYDFSSMKKAVEMHEEGINKTNKSLEQFVNAVIRNFKEMRSALDGQAEIWFYGGVPAVDNLPASEWEDYSIHLGDLYYDTETGYGYRFESNGSAYYWERVLDQDTIYALALANSARDTKDNKRSVFLEQPEPPYGIGDLWLDGETLYVCQVAKDASGVYETADFILASRYVDGIVTLIDADLKRNYSTTVEMKAAIEASEEKMSVFMEKTYTNKDEFSEMQTVVEEASTNVEQTAEGLNIISENVSYLTEAVLKQNTEITATCESIIIEATKDLVANGDFDSFKQVVSSQLEVLGNEITMKFSSANEELQNLNGQLVSKLSKYEKHISFSENGIGIHDANGEQVMELWLDSGIIKFIRGGQQFGTWDGEDFYTSNIVVEVTKRVQLGPYAFVPRANGHMSLLKVE